MVTIIWTSYTHSEDTRSMRRRQARHLPQVQVALRYNLDAQFSSYSTPGSQRPDRYAEKEYAETGGTHRLVAIGLLLASGERRKGYLITKMHQVCSGSRSIDCCESNALAFVTSLERLDYTASLDG